MKEKDQAEKMLKKVKRFILCAMDNDGYPTAKAVLPSKIRSSFNDLYFVTNTHSNYVSLISVNSKSSVYYYNPLLFKGCLLYGEMIVITDNSIKSRLWKSSYKSAYPESQKTYNDPDFCVLKFKPHKGRYYSMFKTTNFNIDT